MKSCKEQANEILLRQMQRLEEETEETGIPHGQDGRWLVTMLSILANAIQYPQVDVSSMLLNGFGKAKAEYEEAVSAEKAE